MTYSGAFHSDRYSKCIREIRKVTMHALVIGCLFFSVQRRLKLSKTKEKMAQLPNAPDLELDDIDEKGGSLYTLGINEGVAFVRCNE